jgi:hypothetical protein
LDRVRRDKAQDFENGKLVYNPVQKSSIGKIINGKDLHPQMPAKLGG